MLYSFNIRINFSEGGLMDCIRTYNTLIFIIDDKQFPYYSELDITDENGDIVGTGSRFSKSQNYNEDNEYQLDVTYRSFNYKGLGFTSQLNYILEVSYTDYSEINHKLKSQNKPSYYISE